MGLTIRNIQDAVCVEYNISRRDLLSARRQRATARPRQVGYWLARELTLQSYPKIARSFCRLDHTSVIHGCRVIDRLREDAAWRARTDTLRAKLELLEKIGVITPPQDEWSLFTNFPVTHNYKMAF